jgi:putative ABC transport system substrate-binding protein
MTDRGFALVLGLGLLLAAPLAAEGQPAGKPYRIGVLSPGSAEGSSAEIALLRQALRELGYVEGQNIRVEWHFAGGRHERLPALAAELVAGKVDVIFGINSPAAQAAMGATSTIPIVFVRSGDPVASGLVPSLARPGGNVTGLASFVADMSGKRLELLKEAIPRLSRVAVLWNAPSKGSEIVFLELKAAGPLLGLQILDAGVRGPTELPGAFEAAAKGRAGAVVVIDDLAIGSYQTQILELAAKHRLGVASIYREFARAGGLMAYGPSLTDTYQRAATYVDRILKGAKPGNLPVERPTKFDLVVNLRTAKTLGLTIPPSVLARADETIQ